MNDTEGEDIEGAKASSLFADGKIKARTYAQVRGAAQAYGVRVLEQATLGELVAGFAQEGHRVSAQETSPTTGVPRHWTVVVNQNFDEPSRFATLAHELGHIYCGHLGGHSQGLFPSRRELSREAKELEAESVAWLVCQRNGIQPRSVQYLAEYVRGVNLSEISMFAIFDAANRVESRTSPEERLRRANRPSAKADGAGSAQVSAGSHNPRARE